MSLPLPPRDQLEMICRVGTPILDWVAEHSWSDLSRKTGVPYQTVYQWRTRQMLVLEMFSSDSILVIELKALARTGIFNEEDIAA